MGANKTGSYPRALPHDRGGKIVPSIMEFPTISLTGAAPAHVQARVLAEYKANQARLKQLGNSHG